MRKIIIDDAIPYLEGRLGKEFEEVYMDGRKISRTDLKDADALLVRTRTRCDAALLADTPVKFVGTATIGMDHYNLPEMEALGIEAVNAPGCNAPAVAQYVWASLLRMGLIPGRHKVGIVGFGHVGHAVAELGRLLGVELLFCDPPRRVAGYTDVTYHSLNHLAKNCDAVTFHTPLTTEGTNATWHITGLQFFKMLRHGAMIVNAARGGVVNEKSLVAAMMEKQIRCAIDTWEGEKEGRLNEWLLQNAIIATPHIAGYSRQGKERATRMVLDSLGRHFNISLPTADLEGEYIPPRRLTPEAVMASYDPLKDTFLLRDGRHDFEHLRNFYPLREEIGF